VLSVKEQISIMLHVPASCQRLKFGRHFMMNDHQTLEYYNIINGSILEIVGSIFGGSGKQSTIQSDEVNFTN